MKKKTYNKKIKKGLNLFQAAIILSLSFIYYYGFLSIAMIVLTLIVVTLTGNANPVINAFDSSPINILYMLVGAIICYPAYWLQKYLIKRWRETQPN